MLTNVVSDWQRRQIFHTAVLVHRSAKKVFQSSDITSQVCLSISSRIPLYSHFFTTTRTNTDTLDLGYREFSRREDDGQAGQRQHNCVTLLPTYPLACCRGCRAHWRSPSSWTSDGARNLQASGLLRAAHSQERRNWSP